MEWDKIQFCFYFGLVIFILLFLIFKVFKVERPLKTVRFWVIWTISTLVAGVATWVFLIVLLISSLPTFPSKSFDSKLWLTDPYKRTEMIDSLIASKLLDHKSKSDIVNLLGQPLDSCPYFSNSGRDMIYNLGPERSAFGVDSEWLLIWLKNDTVIEYKVTTD